MNWMLPQYVAPNYVRYLIGRGAVDYDRILAGTHAILDKKAPIVFSDLFTDGERAIWIDSFKDGIVYFIMGVFADPDNYDFGELTWDEFVAECRIDREIVMEHWKAMPGFVLDLKAKIKARHEKAVD